MVLTSKLQHDQVDGVSENQHHSRKHDLSSTSDHAGSLDESKIKYPNPPLHNHKQVIKAKKEGGKETKEHSIIEFVDDGNTYITVTESKQYDKIIVTVSSSGGGGSSSVSPATTVVDEVAFGQVPVVGTGTLYARHDHTHGTPASPTVPNPASTVMGELSFNLVPVVGTGTLYSRHDHTHGSPDVKIAYRGDILTYDTALTRFPSGTEGQVLTVDSGKACGLRWSSTSSAASTVVSSYTFDQSAVVGTSSYFARADHLHGTPDILLEYKGDLLTYGTVMDVFQLVRMGTGSFGQILSVDGSTTTGLAWIDPPASTDVLSDKGDILTFSTASIRLGSGSEGQILSVNSSETGGLKWIDNTIAGTIYENESLSGSRTSLSLSVTPSNTCSLSVYYNGQRIRNTSSAGDGEYYISGSSVILGFTASDGEWLYASYRLCNSCYSDESISGSRTSLILTYSPIASSLDAYYNGLKMRRVTSSSGIGEFILSANTMSLGFTASDGEWLYASYLY
jgi:hypothetical protein